MRNQHLKEMNDYMEVFINEFDKIPEDRKLDYLKNKVNTDEMFCQCLDFLFNLQNKPKVKIAYLA